MMRSMLAVALAAQTVITPPNNRYSIAEDLQLGQQAATQVEQQLPLMRDDEVTSYVEGVGRRLVEAIPPSLQRAEFKYTFKAINVREINAFALPGGPMYVNRGMLEAAHNEGEVAGVMAHEISHVVLRHGTAQASKATKYEVGSIVGAIAGAVIGGRLGTVVAEGARFGLGASFLRFGREYERQADIEGAQIMARAGYDPRDMANMFQTIQKQSRGSGGPEWLSDHPDPGNRSEYILKEAQSLRVEGAVRDTGGFEQLQMHLKRLPPAPTTEEATRESKARGTRPTSSGAAPAGSVEPPSPRYTQYAEGERFRVSVPSNWRELPGSSAVTFAPPGAYGTVSGQSVFTHGVELGISRNETHDLQTSTEELIDSLARGNPGLRRASGYDAISFAGRRGLRTLLSNRSAASGELETIELYTGQMRDGSLFYVLGVAPTDRFRDYAGVFDRIVGSLRIND
jgi:Zn-dependent protease with chaperone function